MTRFKIPLLVLAATIVIVWMLYTFQPSATKSPPPQVLTVPVSALTVQRQNFKVNIHSQGIVAATTKALLSAQVRGNIVARHPEFERGGRFKAGDVLLTLDDGDYRAALKLAQANYSKVKVALEQEQARSVSAINDWQRLGFKDKPSDLTARRPQVAAAQADLASADASVAKAQLDMNRTRILAPFDGRVVGDTVNLGSYVTPGMTLATIIEADKLKVALPISAQWRSMLRPKDEAGQSLNAAIQISLPADNGARWLATVGKTGAAISADSRQFFIIADIDVASGRHNGLELLVGDYVDALIEGRVLENVVVIPRSTLYQGHFVGLIKASKIYKTPVHVVWSDADVAVIDRGLHAGEQIATTSMGSIVSGAAVTVIDTSHIAEEGDQAIDPQRLNTPLSSNAP